MDLKTFRLKIKGIKERTISTLQESLTTGIQNLERNYLHITNLSLKEIIEKLNFLNTLFNSIFFFQYESEKLKEDRNKIIDSSDVLIKSLRQELKNSYNFFKSTGTSNSIIFNKMNTIYFDHPTYSKEIFLDIPGFHFSSNKDTFFELYIDIFPTYDHTTVMTTNTLEVKTIPYRYVGNYSESIDLTIPVYETLFETLTDEYFAIDKDGEINNSIIINKNEDGKLTIDTSQTTSSELYLSYTPKTSSIAIPIDGYIKSIYLKTNSSEDIKKGIILVGEDIV